MDWSNEDYVRMYTRETSDDSMLSWQAIALWRAMLCRFDRSGLIDTRRGHRGLAALVRIPADVVEPALAELIEDGRVQFKACGYFAPNFMTAQTATKSDKQRQKESRDRRNATAQAMPNVTERDQMSRVVTVGHEPSQPVTLTSASPLLCLPEGSLPRAIPPTPVPTPATDSLDAIWADLETERRCVAEHHGTEYRPMVAHDSGRSDLAAVLVEASRSGTRPVAVSQARHAIAVAGAEARADRSRQQWLTGAIFSPKNFRRLAVADLAEASRARAGPRGRFETDEPRKIQTLT